MQSDVFLFKEFPAHLSLEEDVLYRPAFRIFTWHGESTGQDDQSAGWWHLSSGIFEPCGRLDLFDEVTTFGYELDRTIEVPAEQVEAVLNEEGENQLQMILGILLQGWPDLFKPLTSTGHIPGAHSPEFGAPFANQQPRQ